MYEYYVKLLATLFILLDHAAFTHVTDRGEACVRAIHCKMSYTFSSVSQPYVRAEYSSKWYLSMISLCLILYRTHSSVRDTAEKAG